MALARPSATLMRNALSNDLKKHVAIATGISVVLALGYKFLVRDKRMEAYKEFYRFASSSFFFV